MPKGTKRGVPDGLWSQCPCCNVAVFSRELESNLKVCPKCDFHFPLTARERIDLLVDAGTFETLACGIRSADPLQFQAAKSYRETLDEAERRTGLEEAIVVGTGEIEGRRLALGVMDFNYVGGSMGSVVGEKMTRIVESSLDRRLPLLAVCASGGARMQEGMFSLMQMAKVSAALAHFHQAGLPYISLLCHPTTGGVMASFATLADVVIAEPKALIRFAGQRVIEQTIKEKLPKDFPRAEFLLDHGMIDLVVDRPSLRRTVSRILDYLVHD